jgi:hypothetical protein
MSDQNNPERRNDMRARLTKLFAGLAAVAALAVGGSALAGAAGNPPPASPPAVAGSADTTQQGDQTAPDTGAASESSTESASSESSSESSESATESESSESTSEVADPSDGPGGHADEPGNANADHQFQGEE